ncbi:glycosyltransferase [Gammaproteobacteria bacterium]|nr:glycosyltransferase [Gammaproteobacteria bacterium]
MKILAVVVTFNRKDLLMRCLDHLKIQTIIPDKILVINNDSTDGTEDVLINNNIDYITQENTGSAGGWHTGISYALANNFDACWLMDDDGFPDSKALKILSSRLSADTACASSVVLRENEREYFVFPFPVLNNNNFPILGGIKRRFFSLNEIDAVLDNNQYPFAHLFNGALLNMSLVAKVGNINKDYFIMGDEVDFFYRLREEGEVITCFESKHFHPDVSSRPYSPEKIYYLIKNTIIINYLYLDNKFLRSILNVPVVLFRTAKRNGWKFLFSIIIGSRKKFLYQAIVQGFRGSLGNDLNK